MNSSASASEPAPRGAGLASTQHAQPVQLVLPFPCPPAACSGPAFGAPKFPPRPSAWRPLGRCSEKGCVFPAIDAEGRCLQHQRQWREPVFYSSHQPSSALIEQGRFGPSKLEYLTDPKGSYGHDRRRLDAEREDFLVEQN